MGEAPSSRSRTTPSARPPRLAAAGLLLLLTLGAGATPTGPSLAPDPGTPPPGSPCRVALLAPRETDVLYGPTAIAAEASCPERAGVAEVVLLVDGQVVARAARPPYRTLWDAGGSFTAHVVVARLHDRQGGVATAAIATQGSALREMVRVTSTPIDRVELSVAVTDRGGRPVGGLTKDDFVVREDGREQRLDAAEPERRPLSVAVLVDVSTSTKDLWRNLTQAAPALARTLGSEDAAKVIAFSGPAYLVQDFTHDVQAIAASMARFREWGGGTSLYDTLASVGVELAWGRGGRQAVVLLTDGIDTLSRLDAPRLRNYLRRTDVTIETLLLRPAASASYPGYGRFVRDIGVLSRETGGRVRQLKDLSGMEAAFRELGEGLQNRYHLAYHSDRAVRAGAWRSLEVKVKRHGARARTRGGVLGSRDIVDYLVQDLRSGDAAARRKAAEWLGAIGPGAPPEALLLALSDRSSEVRAAAAASLGRIREPRAIPDLVRLLGDPDERMRHAASEALQGFGPAAVPGLLAALEQGSPEAQMQAMRALAEIGDARAVEAITRLALPPTHPADPRVRGWALWSLATIGRPDAAPVLERAAADRDAGIRQVAMRALGELGTLESLPALARAASDGAPEVRREALASLERVLAQGAQEIAARSAGAPRSRLARLSDGVFGPLIAALRQPAGPERGTAMQAFGALADARVIETGVSALADAPARPALLSRCRDLRDQAVRALAEIAFPPAGAPAADDDLRAAALRALGASGRPVAVALILGGLAEVEDAGDQPPGGEATSGGEGRPAGSGTTWPPAPALCPGDPSCGAAAGPAPAVVKRLSGPLAAEARAALARLTGEAFARHAVLSFSGRPGQEGADLGRAVLALALFTLEHQLAAGDPAQRQEAARVLGESRRPEAIPALQRAAADAEPDAMARAAARQALEAVIAAMAREGFLGDWAASSAENAGILAGVVRRAADDPGPDAAALLQAIGEDAPEAVRASRPPPTAP